MRVHVLYIRGKDGRGWGVWDGLWMVGRGIFCLKLDKIPRVTLGKDLSNHYLELP